MSFCWMSRLQLHLHKYALVISQVFYVINVVKSLADQIKLLSNVYRLLFQILVVWDTISDWPYRLVNNSFIVRACPKNLHCQHCLRIILCGLATPAAKKYILSIVDHQRTGAWRMSWSHRFMTQYKSALCHPLWRAFPRQSEIQSFHKNVN